ncbi:MAG: hypothetical protein PVG75_09660 [Thioalkalispiraceae bacterium]|jgi:hypothetical protein
MARIIYRFGAAALVLLFVLSASPLLLASGAQEKVLFLIEDADHLVASNTLFSRFDQLKLNAKEQIVRQEVAEAVAVVVTNQRLVAYGAHAPGWKAERLNPNEQVESITAEDSSALVVTSDRLLNFYGRRGNWAITKRAID